MMQRQPDTGSVPAPQSSLRNLFPWARLPRGAVALPQNATWSLAVEPGATLALQAGSAWVTFEGDPDDHLLDGPASFTAPRRGRVALWALSPVRFELEPSAPRRAA